MTHGYMCPKLMDQHKPSASLKHCEILFLHCFCNSIARFLSVNSGDDIMPSCQKVGWDWYPAVICLQKYLARSMYNLAVFLNILLTQSQTVTFFFAVSSEVPWHPGPAVISSSSDVSSLSVPSPPWCSSIHRVYSYPRLGECSGSKNTADKCFHWTLKRHTHNRQVESCQQGQLLSAAIAY